MRILWTLVTKNEVPRYLESCLAHLLKITSPDNVFLYDDQSTDGTLDLASHILPHVMVRPDGVPTFREAEGSMREHAWTSMIDKLKPEQGDWIFSIDADEFFLGSPEKAVAKAEELECLSMNFKIHEIWKINPIMKRVDGFWDTITGTRAIQYFPNANQQFASSGMGCGSVPQYGLIAPVRFNVPCILHYGYASPEDVQPKYDFYTSKFDNGHSSPHIESIIGTPNLLEWVGERPVVWRGKKTND